MTDDELLAHFASNAPDFQKILPDLTTEEKSSFCKIARIVHDAGLDWYFTDKTDEYFRFGRKNAYDKMAGRQKVLGFMEKKGGECRLSFNAGSLPDLQEYKDGYFPLDGNAVNVIQRVLVHNQEIIRGRLALARPGLWPDDYPPRPENSNAPTSQDAMTGKEDAMPDTSTPDAVNLILYGPPGTGKTYATAAEAVALCGETVPKDREELMAVYHRLMRAGRIEFVTFHQSLAYEDFVEGLRPQQNTTVCGPEGEQPAAGFTLAPKDGIFRQIVREAMNENLEGKDLFFQGKQFFKISLDATDGSDNDHIFENAIKGRYATISYGNVDLRDPRFADPDAILHAMREADVGKQGNRLEARSGWVRMPTVFRNSIRNGDILIVSRGENAFRAIGMVTGDYDYKPLEAQPNYVHRRRVEWLWVDPAGQPVSNIYPPGFSGATLYQLDRNQVNIPVLEQYIEAQQDVPPAAAEPYVLIIDEINRANISKVFGELITLLEPDKRLGKPNELRVRLPYSGDLFGVPSNLHIIGTMNTADRSIALLDTALRRRFDFRELMPDPDQLKTVDGINLTKMLRALNERIEYLFDREHQIGHAYFIGCKNRSDIDRVMRDRIIPLLAEYFYEDWDKIAVVLGDADTNREGGFLKCDELEVPAGLGGKGESDTYYFRWRVRTVKEGFAYRGLLDA
ncbi:AAA family ATPase [Komagataeibacter europaeus]|uniref:AAA family ATPase n=1 Tax=Komagataeibacter europaeus TaxID=33995 RepID=UPI000B54E597|nr:AAA family ATPase [Komagataeibacter europaeus]ARW17004.1 5-methylcytosine-specific restriction enzyme [Komagataeibacter europaeus]